MNKCIGPECVNLEFRDGMCAAHNIQYEKDGALVPLGSYAKEGQFIPEPMPRCAVSHCVEDAQSRKDGSFCKTHYRQHSTGKDPEEYRIETDGRPRLVCAVDDCSRRRLSCGVCKYHQDLISGGKMLAPIGVFVELKPECAFEGCDRLAKNYKEGSLCQGHYIQKRNGATLRPLSEWGAYARGEVECAVTSCAKPATTRDLCASHFSTAIFFKISTEELVRLRGVVSCQNPGCESTDRLYIDHDHKTGLVRDILCHGCNTALGMLHEDPAKIEGLLEYLKKHAA